MTRPVLSPAVRRALDVIRRTLRRHPELRQRTADYFAGELPEGTDHDEEERAPHRGARSDATD